MKLSGRNALITGASQGLGKAIAEQFLREGANVALCARSGNDLDATRAETTSSRLPCANSVRSRRLF